MIGLALVGAFSTLAVSFGDSVDAAVDSTVEADFIVTNANFLPMPAEVAADLAAVEGMGTVSRIRFAPVASFGQNGNLTGVDAATINDVTTLTMTEGSADLTAPGSLLIDTTIATNQGIGVGDTVELTFANGETKPFVVTGVYSPEGFFSGLVVSNDDLDAVGTPQLDTVIYAKVARRGRRDDRPTRSRCLGGQQPDGPGAGPHRVQGHLPGADQRPALRHLPAARAGAVHRGAGHREHAWPSAWSSEPARSGSCAPSARHAASSVG